MKWLAILGVLLLVATAFAEPQNTSQEKQNISSIMHELRENITTEMNQTRERIREKIYESRIKIREIIKERIRERIREANKTKLRTRGMSHIIHNLQDIAEEQNKTLGQLISGFARKFNNSAMRMETMENRIRNRGLIGHLKLIFFGGDTEAADEIEQEVNATEEELNELEEVAEGTEGDTKELLKEQAKEIRERLQELRRLAREERRRRGIFWFLFRR